MKFEMLMPQMGESITEATILKWGKAVGDAVKKDETILEISTDKVDSEIPAPASGVLVEIIAQVGQTVAVKSIVAVIDTEGAATSPSPKTEAPVEAQPVAAATPQAAPVSKPIAAPVATDTFKKEKKKPELKSPLSDDLHDRGVGLSTISQPHSGSGISDRFYSPLVRNLALQYSLSEEELSQIPGSGADGRLTKNDLLSYLQENKSDVNTSHGSSSVSSAPAAKKAEPKTPILEFGADGTRIEAMDSMRKKIAEHMVRSKATSPHVYTVNEVDLSNIAKWRQKHQAEFLKKEGFKLSFTPFFLEATAHALSQFPQVNASVNGENIIYKKNINVGCAVALGTTGLIVPVIKNADQLNIVGMARALQDIATRARNKKLVPDDTQGGTFTVTNPGTFGSIIGYPIISQPQLAILGVGAIKKRPVVVDDMIAIREIVFITLSYDHRVIDGSVGGSFLNTIAKYLEQWDVEKELY
jgi:2-oxoglutarate dehydrogenase E2 component (dihydrolipoamide succinyltransferase)